MRRFDSDRGLKNSIMPEWWNGIHVTLKMLWAQAHVGSSPTSGKKYNKLCLVRIRPCRALIFHCRAIWKIFSNPHASQAVGLLLGCLYCTKLAPIFRIAERIALPLFSGAK